MSNSSRRAGAAWGLQSSRSLPARRPETAPGQSLPPHRPFLALQPGESSRLPPPHLRSAPPPPPSSTSKPSRSRPSPPPGPDRRFNHVPTPLEKASYAYGKLLKKGTLFSETPEWLIASATSAVPAHQPKWAFRTRELLASPRPDDAEALEKRRVEISRVRELEQEVHDMALADMNEKLHRLAKALPQSFVPPKETARTTHATRLTMALMLAREMDAAHISPGPDTYRLLFEICLAEQDDRLATLDRLELERALLRDRQAAEQTDEPCASKYESLRSMYESASWMERRPDLLAQSKPPALMSQEGKNRSDIDTAWFGSTEWEVAWGLYEDAKARGVKLNRTALNTLMKLAFISPELRRRAFGLLSALPSPDAVERLPPANSQMVELLMAPHLQSKQSRLRAPAFNSLIANLDRVLSIYADFRAIGTYPTKEAVAQIAARLVRVGWSRAAVEMFIDWEAHHEGKAKIDEEDWLALLRGACRVEHAITMRNVWDHVVRSGRVTPDVGLIQDCQNLAGAAGLTDLAIECLSLFQERGVPPAEHHYAPIVLGWTRLNDLEAAYHALAAMRADGVAPLPETSKPILDLIIGNERDLKGKEARERVAVRVDEAWYALLDSKEERGVVDVAAANVVMQSCLAIPDFVRATETFNEFESLGLTPDLDTYHHLLDALLLRPLSSAELFDMLLRSLIDKQLAFTPGTYERIIAFLCTQPTDVWSKRAFDFLSQLTTETKRRIRLRKLAHDSHDPALKLAVDSQPNYGPSYRMYEVMLRRCAQEKDPRALALTEEMRLFGLTPRRDLVDVLDRAGLFPGKRKFQMLDGLEELKVEELKEQPQVARATAIRLEKLPLSSDGVIPPHVRDP